MRSWLIFVLGVVAVAPSFSQPGDPRPQFEVAAVRACVGTEPRGVAIHVTAERVSIPCIPLLRLIQDAYQIFGTGTANFMYQPAAAESIEGFPNEMSSLRYSIEAKAQRPQSVGLMRGPMMQRLLEERFHLKIRREIREGPIYIMTVAKEGPKLQPTTEDSCNRTDAPDFNRPLPFMPGEKPPCAVLVPPTKNGSHIVLDERGISIDALASVLKIGGLPVIDQTGLTGTFDVRLEWDVTPPEPISPDSGAASEPPNTSIISSIRKQLGLQLSRGRGPREFLVIDRLETATEN
jgi:uncharacterized protein (TIGR03435 family)